MAAQIQLTLLLFLFTVFTTSSSSSFDTRNNIDEGKVSANINKLFDNILPSIRKLILKDELDPMELDDLSENLQGIIIQKRILNLTNGWLQGLSNVKRVDDIILSYQNKALILDAALGFDILDISYEYLFRDSLVTSKGDVRAAFKDMQMKITIAFDMTKYKIVLPMVKIIKMDDMDITFEGNKIDPIVNAVIKAITNVFRKSIKNIVEDRISKILQAFVDEINEKIPQPDRPLDANNISNHVLAPFTFHFV